MHLSNRLLFSEAEFEHNSALNGTSIKGSYNTMQFVLRLRDDVRSALNSRELFFETIQASSTSIHENIHWWQHVGSNFGLIFSLSYPAFFHYSLESFQKIISDKLTYKSILKFDKQYYEKYGEANIPDINIILNNYHDIEYAKLFALDNRNFEELLKDNRFFLNIGHCYHILWSSTINTIASTADRSYNFLPKVNNWVEKFKILTEKETVGFFVDSPMTISSLGIKAIYEGQAIFNQMQYLTVALNRELTYENFVNAGMLYGIYIEAFELFLEITGFEKPANLLDGVIGLFLIVCDLAINPNNGFPMDIYDYENFITKNDPGMRFTNFCLAISKRNIYYHNRVTLYSKEEYVSLSKELSESIDCKCSYESISVVLEWLNQEKVAKIMEEEKELNFSYENLPIRVMFSKYLRFQEDKYKYPNVFCWFGFHSTSENGNIEFEIVDSLYQKHHALFTDDYDGEIKPVIFEGREEKHIVDSFNMFYNFNIMYDLISKWVYEEGEFKFDYKWLANERSESFIPLVKSGFKSHFGISLDDIIIV